MAGKNGSEISFIAGIIIGITAGLAVGVLYASAFEAKKRQLLKEKAGVAAEKILEADDGA
jgi:gas vesicle protein